jgi:hypothetical protein
MTDLLVAWLGADRVGDLARDRRSLVLQRRPGAARLTVAAEGGRGR